MEKCTPPLMEVTVTHSEIYSFETVTTTKSNNCGRITMKRTLLGDGDVESKTVAVNCNEH